MNGCMEGHENGMMERKYQHTNRGFEELAADSRVFADGMGHLRHVGTRGFAQGRDGIDAGDSLSKESVGNLNAR